MDDIIAEFIAETNDNLGDLGNDILALEKNPDDADLISRIFRVLHTIKGTCGFLGLSRLESVAHKGEDVLGLVRDGKLKVTPAHVTLILESFDCIRDIVAGIEATGQEPQGDDAALIARLEAVYRGESVEDTAGTTETGSAETGTPPAPSGAPKSAATPRDGDVQNQTLRVNVDVLENLMTVVSELVLTRNQLLQIVRQNKDGDFVAPLQRLNLVVTELQEGVMKTRMQPVGNAWAKLPRIVRDVSRDLGKSIELEMHGETTELDRQVLEMIKDPLTHMVRNSVDHGIETPEERRAAGKPETGRVVLNAYHEGGHINIEISDDGKGLSVERIRDKALRNGLATPEQLAAMAPQQIQQFIFHAGFSTAEAVTAVSGRGVGMDVVRTNIEKIGGAVEMKSEEGRGTTFTIRIPLTLAIVSSLIVGVGGCRFAIPQLTISELVLTGRDSGHTIETVSGAPVLRLRDSLLPLVAMDSLLGLAGQDAAMEGAEKYVVVVSVGSCLFGLVVDQVFDLEEIVVKPLARNLKDVGVFSGNTILGDGNVIMILDPSGVLKTVGVQEIAESGMDVAADAAQPAGQENLLLLFRAGDETLKAVPVDLVERLEEVNPGALEVSRGNKVVQYRDNLMPVYTIDSRPGDESRRPMIVLHHDGRSSGLLVDRILDVAKYYGTVRADGDGDIVDSIIVDERATDVINARGIAARGATVGAGGTV